jgi:GrpB-like predicted nucleotidyltransferase (UPF0157 family)
MAHNDEIGLERGTVKLVPHDPKWAEHFRAEKEHLSGILRERVLEIRHIGSTSIPGMPAKPIIDIVAAVRVLAGVEEFTQDLKDLGYKDKGNGEVPGRRYFVKGGETRRTHHLNFCEMDSFFWRSHLAFCDYLKEHPDVAKEYAALKRTLAEQFPNDREAYTDGKEGFVRSVVERARSEARARRVL